MSKKNGTTGLTFNSLLLLLFIALKLTGHITWPWVWVLSPVWIPLALAVAIILVTAFGAFVMVSFEKDMK